MTNTLVNAIHTDQLNILLVEDNEDDYLIVRDLLREIDDEHIVLEWAKTYESGLDAVWAQHHDLILLDYRLSHRTGLELLEETRMVSPRAPVILMTGQGDRDIDRQAMKAGAVDYLVKDRLDADEMERAIRYAVERQKAAEALQASEDRYRTFVENSTEGIWRFELEQPMPTSHTEDEQLAYLDRYAYVAECNEAMAHLYGYEHASDILGARFGEFLWSHEVSADNYPRRLIRSGYRLVTDEAIVSDRHRQPKCVLHNMIGVVENGLLLRIWGSQNDITERKRSENAQAQLASIVETSDDAIYSKTLDGLIVTWNKAAEALYGYTVQEVTGRPVSILSPLHSPEEMDLLHKRIWRGERIPQFETVHRHKEGRLIDVSLAVSPIFDVASHVIGVSSIARDIRERKSLEAERERVQTETHARAERESLINRIGQALLATTDAAIFQIKAVALLGEALGVDRCYLASWDDAQQRILVLQDYHRADLPSVAGQYRAADYVPVMDALFAHGTAVAPDVRTASLPDTVVAVMEGFALRAVLAVPFFSDGKRITTALWVAMADAPRAWTPEEVSLTEIVAALICTAVEAARVAERERNIAMQLQTALTPAIPARVPGMALAKYYEAVLDEAGVGGDFYDVFPVESGSTILALGDLSGKGLAAAVQVSTVRNMLRYALYRSRTIVGAIENLNSLLAEQHLLPGFATLFVGAYDSATGILSYVNCGQEPALLRRAGTGAVEHLSPTGPVLGLIAGADYEEKTVTLGPGDALAIFTDGLTETGRSRAEMLGIEGIAALLGPSFTPEETKSAVSLAEATALRLIEGVDAAAYGVAAKDDICILVAVVEGADVEPAHRPPSMNSREVIGLC